MGRLGMRSVPPVGQTPRTQTSSTSLRLWFRPHASAKETLRRTWSRKLYATMNLAGLPSGHEVDGTHLGWARWSAAVQDGIDTGTCSGDGRGEGAIDNR